MAEPIHDSADPGDGAFKGHDQARCAHGTLEHAHGSLEHTLERAEAVAAKRRVRLTPVRKRTLEILLEEHRPMGAYEMLDRLSADGFGNQPPVAYRALEFLVKNGLAHRVRRLNAFTACMHPGEEHAPAFLICRECSSVAEASAEPVRQALMTQAQSVGFVIERSTVEVLGLCPACVANRNAPATAQ